MAVLGQISSEQFRAVSMAPVCVLQGRWGARATVPKPVAKGFERRGPMARGADAEHDENV